MTEKFVTLPREVVERTLEALSLALSDVDWRKDSPTQPVIHKAYNATCAAMEQPQDEHEPVAWALSHSKGLEFSSAYPMQKSKQAAEQMARQHMGAVTVSPLYTQPQPQVEQEPDAWMHSEGKAQPLYLHQLPKREPQFDAMSVEQERLAVQFCAEIAGPRGGKPSLPDPVRLLEMAEALYRAEMQEISPAHPTR